MVLRPEKRLSYLKDMAAKRLMMLVDLKPRLLGDGCLDRSLFQGSYTFIVITYS
jgi:hypothetical protein